MFGHVLRQWRVGIHAVESNIPFVQVVVYQFDLESREEGQKEQSEDMSGRVQPGRQNKVNKSQ